MKESKKRFPSSQQRERPTTREGWAGAAATRAAQDAEMRARARGLPTRQAALDAAMAAWAAEMVDMA